MNNKQIDEDEDIDNEYEYEYEYEYNNKNGVQKIFSNLFEKYICIIRYLKF